MIPSILTIVLLGVVYDNPYEHARATTSCVWLPAAGEADAAKKAVQVKAHAKSAEKLRKDLAKDGGCETGTASVI